MPVRVSQRGAPIPTALSGDELMREVGLLAVRRIRTRTQQGIDVNGDAFEPLSDGYVKQRAKAGLGASHRSTLTLSGQMLNEMQVTSTTRTTATISFVTAGNRPAPGGTIISRSRQTGAMAKAAWANGEGRVTREFFGLNEDDEAAIEAAVGQHLDVVLR